jgi:ERF superfamily
VQTSEQINELAAALAKAQGEITGALKDSENPFFSSKYADLASCWDACRGPLSANGLSIVQVTDRGRPVTIQWETKNEKTGEVTEFKVDTEELLVVTTLYHASGQWIRSELPMIPRDASPQGIGSALTYGRRYGLTAMVGVAQMDDDGNQASGRMNATAKAAPKPVAIPKVHPDLSFKAAVSMRELLEMDVDHKVKALKVYDKHLVLAKDNDLYEGAGKELKPAEMVAWKAYVTEAKELEKEDRSVANVGRRF